MTEFNISKVKHWQKCNNSLSGCFDGSSRSSQHAFQCLVAKTRSLTLTRFLVQGPENRRTAPQQYSKQSNKLNNTHIHTPIFIHTRGKYYSNVRIHISKSVVNKQNELTYCYAVLVLGGGGIVKTIALRHCYLLVPILSI